MRRVRSILVLVLSAGLSSCSVDDAGRLELPGVPPGADEPLLLESIRSATEAVRHAPASAAAWGRLGEVYDANSFGEPAVICYARAEALDPGDWRWPYFAGLILRSSEPVLALERLSLAAELNPDYPAIQFHVGFGQFLAERFALARNHFLRALELDPDHVNARLGLARVATAQNDLQAALLQLEALARVAAEEGAVHVHLAQVYREMGRHADADREERLTASSRKPARPDGFTALADPVRDEVRMREGVNSATLLLLARGHALEGRDAAAAAAVERALLADPESVAALVISARMLAERGELDAAGARLERAIALDPVNAGAHVELATVYVLTGRVEPAIESLRRSLALDSAQAQVKVNLAGLLARTGRGEAAVKLLRDALAALPDDDDIRSKLVAVLRRMGRSEEAETVEGQRDRR
jgi:Flp pilus assembly protein TadD